MAALKEDVKVFIVKALACYDPPREVKRQVKEQFKVDVTDQQIQAYNPHSHAGQRLGKKLRDIWNETRKKFLDDVSEIPIAQKSYRLRVLDRLAAKAEEKGNAVLTAALIEQAAKESGGVFTNKSEVKHSGKIGNDQLSDAEIEARIASLANGGPVASTH